MGKEGPCRHCGVTSTPLWRNGPPEKPVLCNACGSRWRTKGSLTNYTPLHSREPLDSDEFKASKPKTMYIKHKEHKMHSKKHTIETMDMEYEMPYSGQNFLKILEVDTSNRSSSGSAISYAESCAHFGAIDTTDLAGSAQSNVWDSLVPSKKRSGVARPRPSPVEKLTKDLYSIMHEQSSHLTISSEEDLLYDCGTAMGSFEIGHGGVLISCLNSKTVEEESEASSLPVDNKSYITEGYSGSASFVVHSENKGTAHSNTCSKKLKVSTGPSSQQHVKRDMISHEKLDILWDRGSPLSSIDLKDIATFEVFMKHTSSEEQQRLMRFLPSMDIGKPPESLRDMFQSSQFMETLSYFQQLLLEGVFDLSFSEANVEELRTLKRLVLLNSINSKWVENYKKIKDVQKKRGKNIATVTNCFVSSYLAPIKRPRDRQDQHYQELKSVMRSPKRVLKSGEMNIAIAKPSQLNVTDTGPKLIQDPDDFIDNEGTCFSPRSIFATPPDRSSMLASLQFTGESSDQDLLLDAPCNSSFPEAELLFHPWNRKTAQDSSPAGEGSLSNNPSSSFSSRNQRHQ